MAKGCDIIKHENVAKCEIKWRFMGRDASHSCTQEAANFGNTLGGRWFPCPLDLLEHLMTHSEVNHLLLVGAYRDNEVGPSHLLMRTLEAMSLRGFGSWRERR